MIDTTSIIIDSFEYKFEYVINETEEVWKEKK